VRFTVNILEQKSKMTEHKKLQFSALSVLLLFSVVNWRIWNWSCI